MLFRVAIAATLVSAAAAAIQTYRLNELRDDKAVQEVELRACGARLDNIIKDLESDAQIDRIPDDALRDVPDHWLLPAGPD